MVLDEDDDDDFLTMVAAAEAEALSATKSKRQKVSVAAGHRDLPEGPYMAALRGSRSSLWQQQIAAGGGGGGGAKPRSAANTPSAASAPADADACFKCGASGHWSRGCPARNPGPEVDGGGQEGQVPEKPCPCGSGSCLVLTSSTAKNPGRKFYRCPIRSENGGCNFFEWCDNPSSGISFSKSVSNYQSTSSVPDLQCPCGVGSCLVLTTKTGKNVGQPYYRCPANEGSGACGFFKWCNEPIGTTNRRAGFSQYNPGSERNSSSCFKCGQGGHWARDCPADLGPSCVASSGSGTCFKCGKAGHWARDCTAPQGSTSAGAGTPRFT